MLLLFIDTETNGLNSNLDNILEIGAVLAKYEPASGTLKIISEFQSLIQPRQELNDTSSRITGLTNNDFIQAPKLLIAQDNWIKWLESEIPNIDNTIIKVIGHSIIDFDIKFLNTEGWFIPPNHQLIDTMFLAKILIPQAQAINLEFLTQFFDLQKNFKNQTNNLQAHRALFDTYNTLALFEKILELLTIYKLPKNLLEYLNQTYLKLDLNYLEYYQENNQNQSQNRTQNQSQNETQINLKGEIIPNSLLKQIETLDLSTLTQLLEIELPKIWRLCLSQTLCIKYLSSTSPSWKLHLHGRDIEYTIINYLLEFSQTNTIKKINKELKYQINTTIEDLLWQVNQVAEDRIYLINSYNLANQILKISENQPQIQLWLSSYEFFELSLQPFWQYHQFKYQFNKLTLIEEKISNKFTSFIQESKDLHQKLSEIEFQKKFQKETKNPVLKYLINKLITELEPITKLEYKTNYNFHLIKDYIQIATVKPDFNLDLAFNNLFEIFPNSFVQSYLDRDDAMEYLEILGLNKNTFENRIEFLKEKKDGNEIGNKVLTLKNPNYSNLIINQIDPQTLTLILCGDNQSFRQCQNICFDPRNNIPYLIIGESGSKTKILSKITNGFAGIVILKQKDLGYITSQIKNNSKNNSKTSLINQVILINKPYLVISNYFKNKWDNRFNANQSTVLDLYLQSTSNKASLWLAKLS